MSIPLATLRYNLLSAEQRLEDINVSLSIAAANESSILDQIALLQNQLREVRAKKDVLTVDQAFAIKDINNLKERIEEAEENKRDPITWRKHTFELVSEDKYELIVQQIEDKILVSPTPSVCWHSGCKHNPKGQHPLAICEALRNADHRLLSFRSILIKTRMSADGAHSLKSYLRELHKQGLIIVH